MSVKYILYIFLLNHKVIRLGYINNRQLFCNGLSHVEARVGTVAMTPARMAGAHQIASLEQWAQEIRS